MGIDRRILANASILAGSRIAAQFANFGFVIVFARFFGAEVLGDYSFALSLGALLAALVGFGSKQLIFRAASEQIEQWRLLIGVILPFQAALSALTLVLIVAVVCVAEVSNSTAWIITLVCLFQLVEPFSALLSAGFSAQERMIYSGLSEALRSGAIFIVGATMIWMGLPAEMTVATLPAAALAVVVILYFLAFRAFGAPEFRLDIAEFISVVRRALPFLGITLTTILFVRVGVLMLRAISGAQAVGLFSSAERIVTAVALLQITFMNAVFPQLVRLWRTDKAKFRKLAAQGQRLNILVTLPSATVLALFAHDIVLLLFGSGYSGTEDVLRIVAWVLVIRGIHGITSTVAIAQNRQSDVVASKFVGLLVLVAACGGLAPGYAATGLAVAVVLAELSVLIIMIWRLGHVSLMSTIWVPFLRTLAACLVAAATAVTLQSFGPWIRGGAVFCVGISALWLCRAVRWSDVQYFRDLARERPAV